MVILRRFPSQIPNLCGSDKHLKCTAKPSEVSNVLISTHISAQRPQSNSERNGLLGNTFCMPVQDLPTYVEIGLEGHCKTNIGFECPRNMFNFQMKHVYILPNKNNLPQSNPSIIVYSFASEQLQNVIFSWLVVKCITTQTLLISSLLLWASDEETRS